MTVALGSGHSELLTSASGFKGPTLIPWCWNNGRILEGDIHQNVAVMACVPCFSCHAEPFVLKAQLLLSTEQVVVFRSYQWFHCAIVALQVVQSIKSKE